MIVIFNTLRPQTTQLYKCTLRNQQKISGIREKNINSMTNDYIPEIVLVYQLQSVYFGRK